MRSRVIISIQYLCESCRKLPFRSSTTKRSLDECWVNAHSRMGGFQYSTVHCTVYKSDLELLASTRYPSLEGSHSTLIAVIPLGLITVVLGNACNSCYMSKKISLIPRLGTRLRHLHDNTIFSLGHHRRCYNATPFMKYLLPQRYWSDIEKFDRDCLEFPMHACTYEGKNIKTMQAG